MGAGQRPFVRRYEGAQGGGAAGMPPTPSAEGRGGTRGNAAGRQAARPWNGHRAAPKAAPATCESRNSTTTFSLLQRAAILAALEAAGRRRLGSRRARSAGPAGRSSFSTLKGARAKKSDFLSSTRVGLQLPEPPLAWLGSVGVVVRRRFVLIQA